MREPIIPASYWVTDRLGAGQYPGALDSAEAARKAACFAASGVTVFVDLTHPADGMLPYERGPGCTRLSFPIVDNDVPTVEEMRAILDAIDTALEQGETVYVHCWGGHGRTGTAIGCWLVRHGMSYADAIEKIRQLRTPLPVYAKEPNSPQTRAQHAFVQTWRPGT